MANLLSTTVTGTINSSGNVTAPTFVGSLSGNASTATDSNLLDGLDSGSFLRSDANDTFTGTITMGKQHALVANNYGRGVYGTYSATRYQHVWSMGTAYNLADDGTGTGNLYGISWTHSNVGGESISGLGHQMLIMSNGDTRSAIGDGIWTKYNIYASGGNSTNWNTAHGWGDHAGLYDAAGAADAINTRIDNEVLPAIGAVTLATLGYTGATNANYITNNNQLSNGAGYLTSTNDRVYITDSRGAARAPSYYNDRYAQWDFQNESDTGITAGDSWQALLTVSKWSVYDNSHKQEQLIFTGDHLYRRTATSDSAWGTTKKIWDTGNLDAFVGATVSNDTITFTKANGGTVAVTTSDANTNTWRPIDDTPVNGVTDQSISSNWAYDHVNASNPHGTTAADVGADAAGSAAAVDSRIDTDVIPNIPTNNNQLTNGAGYITSADGGDAQTLDGINSTSFLRSDTDDTHSGTLALTGITAASGSIANTKGSYLHIGAWGTGRTAVDAVLVNTAYRSDILSYTRSFTIGDTARNFNGSANVSWSLADIGAEAAGSAAAVDGRIDNEVLPIIPTNNNQLTNGAGYITSSHTHNPSQVGLSNLSSDGNALVGSFTATGDITAFSDARVKENIETIPNALEKVEALRGVTFNKIGEEKRSTGVIAQEVKEVLPEVIHENEEGMLSVAYGNITGVLIEAIKEQQKQIDELKAQLDGLTK